MAGFLFCRDRVVLIFTRSSELVDLARLLLLLLSTLGNNNRRGGTRAGQPGANYTTGPASSGSYLPLPFPIFCSTNERLSTFTSSVWRRLFLGQAIHIVVSKNNSYNNTTSSLVAPTTPCSSVVV